MVKNLPAMQETWVGSLGRDYPLEKGMGLPTPVFLPEEFHGKGAWRATVHRVAKSQTLLSKILHPENAKESTKHLLEPINKFSKVIGYKNLLYFYLPAINDPKKWRKQLHL